MPRATPSRPCFFSTPSPTILSAVTALLILYILVGPAPWLLFAIGVLLGNARMNRLRRPVTQPSTHPRVSILIPAKDEGERVRMCLDSVLALDYPNFDVIAVDDRSADNTGAILDEYQAKTAGNLRALHIPQGGLPAGWLGKCHALFTAAKHANGEWILFVDSDVRVAPDALTGVLGLAVNREYDSVSIMTALECHSFLERLVLPLAAASVSAMCLISLTNDDNRLIAFANGQFFLIRRSAYEAVGGHEAVKDHITEDVALMRILKRAGYRTRLFMGRRFASTRMHSSYRQMLNGWGRIYSGVSSRRPWRILAAIGFALSGMLAYVALVIGIIRAASFNDPGWLIAAIIHFIVMTVVIASFYHFSSNPKRYALLFPLAAPILISLYGYALKMCRTGQVAWRGTSYTYTAAANK
jgi:cellulose synthase/poly-beta-1,6-N-acetylglucosamine synthase-like glycosyltransferase